MENVNPYVPILPNGLRARISQELHELRAISAMINSHFQKVDYAISPNEIDMDDLESKDKLINTPLVSPFLDSDDKSDDGEVIDESEEYGNAGNFYPCPEYQIDENMKEWLTRGHIVFAKNEQKVYSQYVETASGFILTASRLQHLFGWLLEEMHVTWAHLEKKRTKLQLYTKTLEEIRIQCMETASEIPSDAVRVYKGRRQEVLDGVKT
ncbi:hypothetical protein Tco_1087753 [Tanacetum coccineum]